MEEVVSLIVGGIVGVCLIAAVILLFYFAIKYDAIRDDKRAYYLSTLDEHDKAVLNTYAHIKPSLKELFGHGKEKK